VSCYPRCHGWVFVNDIEDVTSRLESVVRDRRRATVAQHTERERGKKQATVAWHLPGLGLGIYIESEMTRQCVLREETKEW